VQYLRQALFAVRIPAARLFADEQPRASALDAGRSGYGVAIDANLCALLRWFVQRRHGCTGTLWEGRCEACLVDSGSYFLACSRYIELSTVRAWMVANLVTIRGGVMARMPWGASIRC
jgi:hypothetical protein